MRNIIGLCVPCASDDRIYLKIILIVLLIEFLLLLSTAALQSKQKHIAYDTYLRLIFDHFSKVHDESSSLIKILIYYL